MKIFNLELKADYPNQEVEDKVYSFLNSKMEFDKNAHRFGYSCSRPDGRFEYVLFHSTNHKEAIAKVIVLLT